jgi:NADPH2:quinone reductase
VIDMVRALVCSELGGEELLEVREDWPTRACSDGQLRVDVRAASVNFPDTLVIRGLYQYKPELPFVPGNECAGVVTEVGGSLGGFSVGDRVLTLLGTGAFASEVVVSTPPSQVMRISGSMSWEDAASFNLTYGTAIHGLHRRGRLQPDEVVLVTGAAGGCGLAAVQIAKAMGAFVIAVAGGDEKVALAKNSGADAAIDHRQVGSIAEQVRTVTGGRGADVVFDTVGGADVRDLLRAMAWNGRFLVVGFAAGEIPTFRANQTILKSISIVGVAYGASAIADPAANREDFDQLFAWYERGLVRPHIGHRFDLDHAADAIRVVTERRALGKVVVNVSADDR